MLIDYNFLNEGKHDIGAFKAIFMCGGPGAGKSYTLTKLSDGQIAPRVINTDKFYEHFKDKYPEDVRQLVDRAKHSTKSELSLCISGGLPMFIDGTSSNISRTGKRIRLLKKYGYDVGMIWVDTPKDVAQKRMEQRERKVSQDFVDASYRMIEHIEEFYKRNHDLNMFIKIPNNEGELNDYILMDAFKKCRAFFRDAVDNPPFDKFDMSEIKTDVESKWY